MLFTSFHVVLRQSNKSLTKFSVRNLTVDMLKDQFTGYHSIIVPETHPNTKRPYLNKIYGEKGEALTRADSLSLASLMREFDAKAVGLGIPTSTPLGYMVGPNGREGFTTLHEFVWRSGPDLRSVMQDQTVPDQEVLRLTDKMLDLHGKVWKSDWPISLDPVLANFCAEPDGSVVYVDRMPPRQRLDDGSLLVDYPNPKGDAYEFLAERYFGPKSARVIYAQTIREFGARPQLTPYLKDMVGKRLGDEAYKQISVGEGEMSRVLTKTQPQDADLLRIMAGEAFRKGNLTYQDMQAVYHHTHIGNGGILPSSDNLERAKSLLPESKAATKRHYL